MNDGEWGGFDDTLICFVSKSSLKSLLVTLDSISYTKVMFGVKKQARGEFRTCVGICNCMQQYYISLTMWHTYALKYPYWFSIHAEIVNNLVFTIKPSMAFPHPFLSPRV